MTQKGQNKSPIVAKMGFFCRENELTLRVKVRSAATEQSCCSFAGDQLILAFQTPSKKGDLVLSHSEQTSGQIQDLERSHLTAGLGMHQILPDKLGT